MVAAMKRVPVVDDAVNSTDAVYVMSSQMACSSWKGTKLTNVTVSPGKQPVRTASKAAFVWTSSGTATNVSLDPGGYDGC